MIKNFTHVSACLHFVTRQGNNMAIVLDPLLKKLLAKHCGVERVTKVSTWAKEECYMAFVLHTKPPQLSAPVFLCTQPKCTTTKASLAIKNTKVLKGTCHSRPAESSLSSRHMTRVRDTETFAILDGKDMTMPSRQR